MSENPARSYFSRPVLTVAVLYGFLIGVIACLVYLAMHYAQIWLWNLASARWMIFPIVLGAGVGIAFLARIVPGQSLEEQIADASDAHARRPRGRGLIIGLSAFLAVVCGGAIGPEAGILALVSELSTLVTMRVKEERNRELLTKVGVDSSLGAIYGSPVAGVAYDGDGIAPHKVINIIATAAGILGFVLVLKLSDVESMRFSMVAAPEPSWELLWVVLAAALVGTALAVAYNWFDRGLGAITERFDPFWVTVVGSALMAAVFTAWPVLRFSGQHELVELAGHPQAFTSAGVLLAVAAAKLGAMSLTVRSGWRGGLIFPLLFVGASSGVALGQLLPGEFFAFGAIAGIGAVTTGVMRKPLLVILLVIFLIPGVAWLPLVAGVAIGTLANLVSPPPSAHH